MCIVLSSIAMRHVKLSYIDRMILNLYPYIDRFTSARSRAVDPSTTKNSIQAQTNTCRMRRSHVAKSELSKLKSCWSQSEDTSQQQPVRKEAMKKMSLWTLSVTTG
jgi:hypothetical protein